ncbi:MAG: 2OG-Fe(II) oxygenase [Oceanospirillaceae bacterium]|nr:2OG-Fe(II) oxygenase [Oceanospirillaceae bacterium]
MILEASKSAFFSEQQLDTIADKITDQGYLVLKDAVDNELLEGLLLQAKCLSADHWREAGIGRKEHHQIDRSIRSDKIHWINGAVQAENQFLELMESLRLGLNRRLYLGLYDYESHYAKYANGMFYKKHLDALKGKSNRVLSSVLYLNANWLEEYSGELLIHDPHNDVILASVSPQLGTMVLFLSEKFPHQVLPAKRERFSIAGWFRVNNS